MVQVVGPFHILMNQSPKPGFQLLKAFFHLKALNLFRFNIAVGQLHHGSAQLMVAAVKIAITHGLSHVHLDGLIQIIKIHIDAFDLIDGHA